MILVNQETRLVVQGITGKAGSFHAKLCLRYGTEVVAGVTPGKSGTYVEGIPVFDTVREAVEKEDVNVSMIFVPPPFAQDAIMEAADAGIDLAVVITENIPVQDVMRVKAFLKNTKTRMLGPNCPGLISPPSRTKVGIMPDFIFTPGRVGIMSRSGSLGHEVTSQLSKAGIGQSTCVGIGGDPIVGTTFIDCLKLFDKDPETDAVVMAGEIGGTAEEEAAEFIKYYVAKPVIAYICGLTAPPGKRMGHAGAIVSDDKTTARDKIEVLRKAGIEVAETLAELGPKTAKALKSRA